MSLKNVHPEHVFKVKNGREIKNLYELASELATMSEETFRHHVNADKHDFYQWVLHVVRDDHLADVFSKVKDRRLMLAAVDKRIKQLEEPKKKESHWPVHWTARDYLLGVLVGAVAMLMVTRLL